MAALISRVRMARATTDLTVVAGVAAVSLLVVWSGWRGTDVPAQLFRMSLFQQSGFSIWNRNWYGGHYTVGYSLLFPALAAWIGMDSMAVVSTVAASALFLRLVRPHFAGAAVPATMWFAGVMIINQIVGRHTYALGVVFAVLTVQWLVDRRLLLAGLSAVAAAAASPVAGVFVALFAGAAAMNAAHLQRTVRSSAVIGSGLVAMAGVAPTLVIAVLFPSPGVFPFDLASLAAVVLAAIPVAWFTHGDHRTIRLAAVLTAVSAVALFVVANPLGGNFVRLPQLVAWPLVAASLWPTRRLFAIGLAVPMAAWLSYPAIDVVSEPMPPHSEAAFYAPLIDAVASAGGPVGRVEIPFTADHWEASYVAPALPLARGWERQTDRATNPVFYDGSLDDSSYRTWIDRRAVRWIAVANVAIDPGGQAEVDLLQTVPAWLTEVWRSPDWVLYEVVDPAPLVAGAATLVASQTDTLVIDFDRPGTALLRERFTPYRRSNQAVCMWESSDGNTMISSSSAGLVTLEVAAFADPERHRSTTAESCPS